MNRKPIHPGSLVTLSENRKYSGVVISRAILKDAYRDYLGLEPYHLLELLEVLWNDCDLPINSTGIGNLGAGRNPRFILEDLVELVGE